MRAASMRRAREAGAALVVALAVIALVGLWGGIWARSAAELRRRADTRASYEAGLDLADSALARERAALSSSAGSVPPLNRGGVGTATVTRALQGDACTLTARADLAGERPLSAVVVSLTLERRGERWVVTRRDERAVLHADTLRR